MIHLVVTEKKMDFCPFLLGGSRFVANFVCTKKPNPYETSFLLCILPSGKLAILFCILVDA